jgi:phosphoribosylformylglycinamidine (FGAM) synthase-like amidotransferase family enzyme
MARAAVLQIPGVNCEYETARALEAAGLEARIVRFNEPASVLSEFDAYVIPGGFAFQDRIRAGAVAAKLPAVERIARESESGKPVLGICNGAQVLVETGLVPGLRPGRVEMALAPNEAPRRQGYLCRWIRVRATDGPVRATFTATNPAGNVLAFMPHPERAAWLRMMPQDWPGPWGERRRAATGDRAALEGPGPGRFLFDSLANRLGAAAAVSGGATR